MKRMVVVFVLAVVCCGVLFSDMGSIPFVPRAEIYESSQQAFISWNGKTEILVLSTDLRASEETKVLEVIPFPAKPLVRKGSMGVFDRALQTVNRGLKRRFGGRRQGFSLGGGGGTADNKPAGKVVSRKKIGAHDISTIQVKDGKGFVAWAMDYLKKQGADNPVIPPPLKKVIEEYIKDGFTWFVFDIVSLGKDERTKDAMEFVFNSTSLYYPLRITRTEKGDTTVQLFVVTRKSFRKKDFIGIPFKEIHVPHKPFLIKGGTLRRIHGRSYALLRQPVRCVLRMWEIRGKLSEFKNDLLIAGPYRK